jgi:hypothetical protein
MASMPFFGLGVFASQNPRGLETADILSAIHAGSLEVASLQPTAFTL